MTVIGMDGMGMLARSMFLTLLAKEEAQGPSPSPNEVPDEKVAHGRRFGFLFSFHFFFLYLTLPTPPQRTHLEQEGAFPFGAGGNEMSVDIINVDIIISKIMC